MLAVDVLVERGIIGCHEWGPSASLAKSHAHCVAARVRAQLYTTTERLPESGTESSSFAAGSELATVDKTLQSPAWSTTSS